MIFRPTFKTLKAFAIAAFSSAAMFGQTTHAQEVDWNYLQSSPVRLETFGVGGNQPGVQDGYHRVGGFLPLFEDSSSLFFIDGHGNVNYDSGNWSGDFGVGYRQDVGTAVFGGNAYYNYREYSNGFAEHDFSTIGFGVEALMEDWAFRSNAAFALNGRESNGRTAFALPGGPDLVPQMGGSMGVQNIRLATQTENWDEALDTVDVNVSRKLPFLQAEVGAGAYYLYADRGPNGWGVNGNAEFWLTPNVAGNVNVSHDGLFDTTVYGGFSLYFGGPAIDASSRTTSVRSRLWSRVQRRDVVPVLNYTAAAPDLLASDATTGDLITVAQIGTGDDLLGAPDLLEDDGEFIDIILVDPDATFGPGDLPTSIALNDNQRLLSAHLTHSVDTFEVGLIDIPETGLVGGPAMLTGATGIDVITLADGNEVNGIQITSGMMGSAIIGTDVDEFLILNNIIDGPGGVSIDSSGLASVTGLLADNTITGGAGIGVEVIGADVELFLLDNIVSGNAGDNVHVDATGEFSGLVVNNEFNDSMGGNGFFADVDTISTEFVSNLFNENDADGLHIEAESTVPMGALNIVDNTANLNGTDGISVAFFGDADSTVNVDMNTAFMNGGDGISLVTNGMGDILGSVTNNTTNNNDPGIFVQTNNASSDILLDLTGNIANNNTMQGILIDSANDFTGEISGNFTNMNGDVGLEINTANDINITFENHIANMNMDDGVSFNATNDVTGTITNVTANGNGDDGFDLEAGNDFTASITNSTANMNTDDGFDLDAGNDFTGDFMDNTFSMNLVDGAQITAGNDLINEISGNTGNDNTENGILVDVTNDIDFVFTNNTLNGNNFFAARMTAMNNFLGEISDSTFNDGTLGGLSVSADNDVNLDVTGNTANSSSTGTGIELNADNNLMGLVDNNTTNSNAGLGIDVQADFDIDGTGDFTADVTNNTANMNDEGFFIGGVNINSNVSGNTANDSTGDNGIQLSADNDIAGLIDNNSASGNASNGLRIVADLDNSGAGDVTANISNNIAGVAGNGNGTNGILIIGENLFSDVTGNVVDANTMDGISLDSAGTIGTAMSSSQFSGNMAGVNAGNGGAGLRIDGAGGMFVDVLNNTTSNNDNGLILTSQAAAMTTNLTGNTAILNTDHGIQLTGNIAATGLMGALTSNTANGNDIGIGLDNLLNATVDLTSNQTNSNRIGMSIDVDNDFIGDVGSAANILLGNTANTNTDTGFFFDIGNNFTGDFANNTGIGNTTIDYDTTAGGIVTGTVTPNTSTTNMAADFMGNIATP